MRSLRFACTFLETPESTSPTLWVGTNRGHVMAYLLTVPEQEDKRRWDYSRDFKLNLLRGESVEAVLAKEIQLKHMAPVIDIEASTQIWTQLIWLHRYLTPEVLRCQRILRQ